MVLSPFSRVVAVPWYSAEDRAIQHAQPGTGTGNDLIAAMWDYCNLTIFSHRGLAGDASLDASPILSEDAILHLARRGIRYFDLDLAFSVDGALLVSHPAAIQAALGMDVFRTTEAVLRSSARRILTASRLFSLVAAHNLTVALDLKGSSIRPDEHATQLVWLAQTTLDMRLTRNVWLWADTTGIARRLKRQLQRTGGGRARPELMQNLTMIKPLRDRGLMERNSSAGSSMLDCTPSQLARGVDERFFTMLGPSVRCANQRLLASDWAAARWGRQSQRHDGRSRPSESSRALRASGQPPEVAGAAALLVWVVDDAEAELPALLRLGVRMVISNAPLKLRAAAIRECARGREATYGRSRWTLGAI